MVPSIKKNYTYRLIYDVLLVITPFITTPYISRVLGADRIGDYSYTSSIMSYFTLIAALGTVSYGTREISRKRDDRKAVSQLFWEIELVSIISTLVCLVGWIFVIVFYKQYRYYFLALTPLLLATLFDISWLYTGHEDIKYTVVCNTIFKLLGIALLFIFVRTKDDVIKYVLINSCISLFGNLSMWIYLPKMVDRPTEKIHLKKHFKETLVYFIPTIATSIYTILDKTLIGLITNDSYQNGYYEQATKVVNMLKTLAFTSINFVLGARQAYLFEEKEYDKIKEKIGLSMNYIFFMGYGLVFGTAAIAERFVPLFFGAGYDPVVNLLYCMLPLVLIIGVSNCLGSQYYTPAGYRKQSGIYIIIGSAVNLCMNLLLIPHFGAVGAVIGSLIAESVISILYLTHCKGFLTGRQLLVYSWKKCIAGAVMLLVISFIGEVIPLPSIVTIILQIFIGSLVYILGLLLMKDRMCLYLITIVKNKIKKN
jgi:O-antigen/teichoic acid export membrane protein